MTINLFMGLAWQQDHKMSSKYDILNLRCPLFCNWREKETLCSSAIGPTTQLRTEYSCAHGAQMNFGYLTPYLTFKPPTHTKIKRSNIPGYAILERFDTCFFQTERCLPLRLPHPHPGLGVPLLLPHPLLQVGSGVACPLLPHLLPWGCQLLHSTRYPTSLKLYY